MKISYLKICGTSSCGGDSHDRAHRLHIQSASGNARLQRRERQEAGRGVRGAVWLLKLPPKAAAKANDLSYSNSGFSEHWGSRVFRMLGVDALETWLGSFRNGREHVAFACRDVTVPDCRLVDFCSVKNTVLDTGSGGTGTEPSDEVETIDYQQFDAEGRRRKINYAEYLVASADAGLSAALAEMRPRIAALDIAKIVSNESYLTDLQRQFYTIYLSARRDRLFGARADDGDGESSVLKGSER